MIDMINKSRNEIAYNLIDVESRPSDEALAKIAQIKDVIKVTVL